MLCRNTNGNWVLLWFVGTQTMAENVAGKRDTSMIEIKLQYIFTFNKILLITIS
jgi:hypothetical protein